MRYLKQGVKTKGAHCLTQQYFTANVFLKDTCISVSLEVLTLVMPVKLIPQSGDSSPEPRKSLFSHRKEFKREQINNLK